MNLDSIRRAVRSKGLTPASVVPEARAGRAEEACIRLARVVEGTSLQMIPIGVAEGWPVSGLSRWHPAIGDHRDAVA